MATIENWLSRRKGKHPGDIFKLDTKNKTPEENVIEILQGLYIRKQNESPTNKHGSSDGKVPLISRNVQKNGSDSRRLSYLNALVTLLCKEERSSLGFTTEELMCCIRISLVDESIVIRAAALRALRYLIKTENDVAVFNTLRLPYLVTRSMDLTLRNEEERAQALRVVRRVIAVVGTGGKMQKYPRAAYVEPGLLRCLAAIARAGNASEGSGDRLSRPAIATLAEIGVLNPTLFIACGGVGALTRCLQECATPRMAEALCGVLLHTLNDPAARHAARVDLRCLCSPYCDFQFRVGGSDKNRDEREMRFTCSRLSLLCVLRSWPGLLHFCHPYSAGGLRALIHALHLPRLEVRKAILDLLYELLGLPQPEWTDEISVALNAVDPSDFQDSWRLSEGFVAAEGCAILPQLCSTGPDITEIHLALLLYCFLEAGLLDGLAEVIITSDTFISVRATVLLGQLLHLMHLLLPPQICSITPPLPSLLSQASSAKPQALAAIAALQRLHSMLEARPAASSLFLDHIIQYCGGAFIDKIDNITIEPETSIIIPKTIDEMNVQREDSTEFLNDSDTEVELKQRHSVGSRADVDNRNVSALVKSKSVSSRTSAAVSKVAKSTKLFNLFERESDSLIKNSLVMQHMDGNMWNWEVVRTILKEDDSPSILHFNDSGHKAWITRIIYYLKPSSNKFSHADASVIWQGHAATRAGCQLIRLLLKSNDLDMHRLLSDFFLDVSKQVTAIETGRRAHECLFSPQHMCNTMCQMYFLFVGQLCHSKVGLQIFHDTKLFENLLELSTKTHHSCYIKLVISSLDYMIDSYPRIILAKTLTCNIQASRLYATQFLNVLLRASHESRELIRKKMKLRKQRIRDDKRIHKNSNLETTSENDMETWLLQMLVGQIKDESKFVVKCAISILEEACSVPAYLMRLIAMKEMIRQNCLLNKESDLNAIDVSAAGDKGYLLWLKLEAAALADSGDPQDLSLHKKHMDFWTKCYNYRYVRLVDAEIHDALTLGGEHGEGRPRGGRRAARVPLHLHSALAQHAPGRSLLTTVLSHHYKIVKLSRCGTEQDIMDLKASMWALGNTAISAQGVQLLMQLSGGSLEDSALVLLLRLAKYCPVYSIRATAFYILGLVGSTYIGANLLYELGWLSVRHTRHDQFPVIQEENWSSKTGSIANLQHLITSPNRHYIPHTVDTDASEHSDHTDQSTAESLHSDHTKSGNKSTLATITIEHHEGMNQDTVDIKSPFTKYDKEHDKRKSHTLPQQSGYPSLHDRPSLSESKTVDIIRDYAGPLHIGPVSENRLLVGKLNSLDQSNEGRIRNTSESSTSGVSSCDSVLGRYAFPDRVLTLSPIPSSSSLYGMKGSGQRPRISEAHRRTSTSSFTGPDAASSPPSQRDMAGYATLKSLNRHRRPHLSESSASGPADLEELSWILGDSRRSKPFSSLRDRGSKGRERKTKLSLLDYDWKPITPIDTGSQKRLVLLPTFERRIEQSDLTTFLPSTDGQCYMGICLPQNIIDIFPRGDGEEAMLDSVDGNASYLIDTTTTVPDSKIHMSPEIHSYATNKGSGGGSGGGGDVYWGGGWRHSPSNCLACVPTRPPSSHELREAFFAGPESPKQVWSGSFTYGKGSAGCVGGSSAGGASLDISSPLTSYNSTQPEPTSPPADILNHAQYMANPLYHRQMKPVLLSLKQRHPEVFRNVCVYSEVCTLLAATTYMMSARRFLQELFLDVAFECFSSEPQAILARRPPPRSSPSTSRSQNCPPSH